MNVSTITRYLDAIERLGNQWCQYASRKPIREVCRSAMASWKLRVGVEPDNLAQIDSGLGVYHTGPLSRRRMDRHMADTEPHPPHVTPSAGAGLDIADARRCTGSPS